MPLNKENTNQRTYPGYDTSGGEAAVLFFMFTPWSTQIWIGSTFLDIFCIFKIYQGYLLHCEVKFLWEYDVRRIGPTLNTQGSVDIILKEGPVTIRSLTSEFYIGVSFCSAVITENQRFSFPGICLCAKLQLPSEKDSPTSTQDLYFVFFDWLQCLWICT